MAVTKYLVLVTWGTHTIWGLQLSQQRVKPLYTLYTFICDVMISKIPYKILQWSYYLQLLTVLLCCMFSPTLWLQQTQTQTQTILLINNVFQGGCAKCQWSMLGHSCVSCCDWFWLLPLWYSLKSTTISMSSTSSDVSSRWPSASCFPLPNSLQWCK